MRLGVLAGCLALAACASVPSTGSRSVAGKQVAFSLSGRGSPTVVLQSGLGDGKSTWGSVTSALAPTHAVFAYDRPGYGDSDGADAPRDPCTIATELRELLRSSGTRPPYLLVGHSIGGLYQYAFSKMYPTEVAGLVLVDATHPTHWKRMQAEAPTQAALIRGLRSTVFRAAMRREFDDQEACLDRLAALPASGRPVKVLTRSSFSLAERGAFETLSRSLQQAWLPLAGAARVEVVEGAGHYIHKDKPERVVEAIRAVAAQR